MYAQIIREGLSKAKGGETTDGFSRVQLGHTYSMSHRYLAVRGRKYSKTLLNKRTMIRAFPGLEIIMQLTIPSFNFTRSDFKFINLYQRVLYNVILHTPVHTQY